MTTPLVLAARRLVDVIPRGRPIVQELAGVVLHRIGVR